MKKVLKKGMLWCLILMVIFAFQPLSASAATKVNLKAPTVSNWKKTWDGNWSTPKADGVAYTITWNKVSGASGYQVKVSTKEGIWSSYRYVLTKKRSYTEAGSTVEKSKARVRAYKVVNGKKQYGPWSKTKVSVKWW